MAARKELAKDRTEKQAAEARKPAKDRRANFARLATIRTNNALNAIRLIGNLSNTNDYEFTDDDVAKMLNAIRIELSAAEARFQVSKIRAARQAVSIAA